MALSKCRLGELIEIDDIRNENLEYGIDDVKGISIQKCFIETKADMEGVSLRPYKLVRPGSFSYVTVTSRNGEKVTLALNTSEKTYIVSSSYVVFRVKNEETISPEYLFMYFNRPEFDRYARFNSWGSARETFDWGTMCAIEIEVPDIETQRKFVDVYKSMVSNQQAYEKGLDDLKLTCDAYIEELGHDLESVKIGQYIELSEARNENLKYGVDAVKGISIEKKFIETKADMTGVSLRPYAVVQPNEFAYVTVTSRNGDKISLAINDSAEPCICSSSYVVFRSRDEKALNPQYLMLFLSRSEFDRYARFFSWGSARETFDWEQMCKVKIPIPDIKTQNAIVDIFHCWKRRKAINERLKVQIKDICPILIRGSIQEGKTA